ncbi:MAG TPA: stage 0 sporulation family protein [Thermodesulfovibrionales bacterium]|nr:stage 0 sporulation family protein [Thermodesulfovibrionales bacterium]
MPDIVGIRFKCCGKIYDFDSGGLALRSGDKVVIESEFGLNIGSVVGPPHHADSSPKDLKRVLRVVTDDDLRQKASNEKFEQEARSFCYERIMARGLPMKLVRAEATLDRKRIVFYFTADGRIDFRELVKDLAARFKTRIEMRQIGVRDKAKLVGGFGLCGKELCCKVFLTTFEPISIKMAKQQDLTLNTGKLSGACGRLMCCLGYEYHDGTPAPGSKEQSQADTAEQEILSEPAGTEMIAEDVPVAEPAADGPAALAEGPGDQQKPPHKRRRRRRHKKKPPRNE